MTARLVRLQTALRGELADACPQVGDAVSARELGLEPRAWEFWSEEHRLAASLLTTFPHIEAPWAFRLQLFAALLDQVLLGLSREDVATKAVDRIGTLWRSEIDFASGAELRAMGDASCEESPETVRFARRFRANAVMELAAWLHDLPCRPTCTLADEAAEALCSLRTEAAVAPAILKAIELDLKR